MKLAGEQVLLRVHLRNTDAHRGRSAADALAERAQRDGMAGATILRGQFGLDASGKLLEHRAWSLAEHLPVIVEIVDSAANIARFLAAVVEIAPDSVMTLERACVLVYRHTGAGASRPPLLFDLPPAIAELSTLPGVEDSPLMKLAEDGQLLRIFIGESDRWNGQPLARAIVLKARELEMAGATVLHGALGFGANSRVHTERILGLSSDLPLVVEIVESAEKIGMLLPFLDEVVTEGLITIESVRVLKYRHQQQEPAAS